VDLQTIIGEVQTIETGCKINLEVQTNLPITLKIGTKMEKGSNSYKNATCWYCIVLVFFKPDVSKELQTKNLLSPKTIQCF
jgi:hypothetical protein